MNDPIGLGKGEIDPVQLQKNRKNATRFSVLAIIVVISIVYAFVQQVAAERNAEQAHVQERLAQESKNIADQNAKEAMMQAAIAAELRSQLDACLRSKK